MDLFYIIENVANKKRDFSTGLRIIHYSSNEHPRFYNFHDGDGPFSTLDELKKKSNRYKKLVRDNLRRAQKICLKEIIIEAKDSIYYENYIDQELDQQLFKMLDHIISGEVTKKSVSGLHYFIPKFQEIIEITKSKNSKGIWEAKIKALRVSTNEWINKEQPSTFFPTEWTKEKLVEKIHEAYINKNHNGINIFQGITKCGIKIEFVIIEKNILSIYPLYE